MMHKIAILIAPLALAACMTDETANLEADAETVAEIEQRLAGYTPQGTRNCLPGRSDGGMRIYDDGTVLVRQAGSIYRQQLSPGCARASSSHATLVTEGTFGNMCSGSIARVVDSTTGIFYGACSIGEWTEYDKVASR